MTKSTRQLLEEIEDQKENIELHKNMHLYNIALLAKQQIWLTALLNDYDLDIAIELRQSIEATQRILDKVI